MTRYLSRRELAEKYGLLSTPNGSSGESDAIEDSSHKEEKKFEEWSKRVDEYHSRHEEKEGGDTVNKEETEKSGKSHHIGEERDELEEIVGKVHERLARVENRIEALEKRVESSKPKNSENPGKDCPSNSSEAGNPSARADKSNDAKTIKNNPVSHAEVALGTVNEEEMIPEEIRLSNELKDGAKLHEVEHFPDDHREIVKLLVTLQKSPDIWGNNGVLESSRMLKADSTTYHRYADICIGVRRVDHRPHDLYDENGNVDTRPRLKTYRKKPHFYSRSKRWYATIYFPEFNENLNFEGFEAVEVGPAKLMIHLAKHVERAVLEHS